MRIILEGADCTGKSTLANILAYKYGLDVCHCTQHDPCDYDFYRHSIRKNNIVWDRHTIGELIYPEIFKRTPQTHFEDARILLYHAIHDYNAKVFVLTADNHILRDRLCSRPDEHSSIVKNIEEINRKFLLYAEAFCIPVIDTTKMTLQEIFDLVEDKNE